MYPNSPQVTTNQPNPFLVNQEDEIDLKVILFNYLQYWPVILICAFLGVAAAFVFNRFTTPVYKVESTVIVKDEDKALGADIFESAGFAGLQGKSNIENEIGVLKSYSLALATINELDLNVQYFVEDFFKVRQIYGNYPVFVKVDWTKKQVVGGLIRLEVIDEQNFELTIENEESFQIYNPQDPNFKTSIESFNLAQTVYQFGKPISG